MAKGWENMTAEERQEARFARWLSGQGLQFKSADAKARYQRRVTRIKDAVQLKKTPDRVPIFPFGTFFMPQLGGAGYRESMYEVDKLNKAMMNYLTEFNPDYYSSAIIIVHGAALEKLGYKLYKWPGFNLPDKNVYQCIESEYMKPDDYATLIDDPTDFFLRTYIPRIMGALEPLKVLPTLMSVIELPMTWPLLFLLGLPEVQETIQKILEAGRLSFEWAGKIAAFDKEVQEMGHVQFVGGISKAPFDVLADTLRGTHAMMMDIFRRPETVLKAIDRLTPLLVKWGLSGPEVSGNPIVFMPLHKGADGWMSDEHFRTFYWPSLKAVIMALIDQGCVPFLFAEGGYNSRLEYLRELPKGRCIWMFDRTDMAKAKEVIGDTTCIAGNVPISKIMTGTPEKIREICKELIDTAGKGGGYIMAMGCSADEGKADTVKAMIEFTKEYGVYK
jgi:Uroporphyrinogen decarboxylase (URO-D)